MSSQALASAIAATGAKFDSAPQSKQESIFGACFRGDIERVTKYINDGGCLDEGDKEKMTMLHHAVVGRHMEVCKLLLAGAPNSTVAPIPVDAGDSSKWTALHYAADKGFTELVEFLIDEAAAAVNARDDMNRTPLHLAVNGNKVDAVKALLARGAVKSAKTVVGWTPMKYAEEHGFTEIQALLQ